MHLNSADDESKALLVRNEEESKQVVQSGKPTTDGVDKDQVDSTCRYTLNAGTVTQGNAVKEAKPDAEGSKENTQVPQTSRHDSVQHEEDFIAKDLLSFAWQIARGMVSTYCRPALG